MRSAHPRMLSAFGPLPGKKINYTKLLETNSTALWPDRAGAGMTVSVDESVLFDGAPSLRVTIPANSSGIYRVGTSAAVVQMPGAWDGKNSFCAIRSSNTTAVSGVGIFLGDAAFSNFHGFGGMNAIANVPEANWVADEWIVARFTTSSVGSGTPVFPGVKRVRVNLNVTSVPTETTVWIGCLGVGLSPRQNTVVLSIDDGYASGFSFVAPWARHYNIPVTFGIDMALVGTPNYFTTGQIQQLYNDSSGLFEFAPHGRNNQNLTQRGPQAYAQDQIDCRNYLRGLGISGDGLNHHPWVQSVYSNAGIAELKAAGFLSARAGGSGQRSTHEAAMETGEDKRLWQLVGGANLTTGQSLSAVQSAISTGLTTENYGLVHIIAHDFAAADAASPPTWSFDKAIDLLKWLADQRAAGGCVIKTWGQWYADLVGRPYVR